MPKRSKLQPSKKVLIAAAVVVVGLGVLVVLKHTSSSPTKTAVSASSATKGESANQQAGQQQNDNPPGQSSSNQDKTSGNSAAGAVLVEPSGDFVSNHHPSLSNQPDAPNLIASSCTTTPGASCKIVFTNGGTSKSLSTETTDAGGSAFWNWKLQDIGLTEGTWSIQAIATLNGQTKTATDAQSLVVSP